MKAAKGHGLTDGGNSIGWLSIKKKECQLLFFSFTNSIPGEVPITGLETSILFSHPSRFNPSTISEKCTPRLDGWITWRVGYIPHCFRSHKGALVFLVLDRYE